MPATVPPDQSDQPPNEGGDEWAALVGAAITSTRWVVFIRLVLLIVIVAAVVAALHLLGVPLPWATA